MRVPRRLAMLVHVRLLALVAVAALLPGAAFSQSINVAFTTITRAEDIHAVDGSSDLPLWGDGEIQAWTPAPPEGVILPKKIPVLRIQYDGFTDQAQRVHAALKRCRPLRRCFGSALRGAA